MPRGSRAAGRKKIASAMRPRREPLRRAAVELSHRAGRSRSSARLARRARQPCAVLEPDARPRRRFPAARRSIDRIRRRENQRLRSCLRERDRGAVLPASRGRSTSRTPATLRGDPVSESALPLASNREHVAASGSRDGSQGLARTDQEGRLHSGDAPDPDRAGRRRRAPTCWSWPPSPGYNFVADDCGTPEALNKIEQALAAIDPPDRERAVRAFAPRAAHPAANGRTAKRPAVGSAGSRTRWFKKSSSSSRRVPFGGIRRSRLESIQRDAGERAGAAIRMVSPGAGAPVWVWFASNKQRAPGPRRLTCSINWECSRI